MDIVERLRNRASVANNGKPYRAVSEVSPDGSSDQGYDAMVDMDAVSTIESLRSELAAKDAEIERLRGERQQMLEDMTDAVLSACNREIGDEAFDYAEQIEKLEATIARLTRELEEARAVVERLMGRVRELEGDRDRLRSAFEQSYLEARSPLADSRKIERILGDALDWHNRRTREAAERAKGGE